jgi:hypothetical protein
MFDALGCAGVARIDFFLTDHGPVLNKVNTMPGMTAASQVLRMFAAAGPPYEQLVARLVDAATVPGLTSPGSDRVAMTRPVREGWQTSRKAEEITVTVPGACPVRICRRYAVLLRVQICAC